MKLRYRIFGVTMSIALIFMTIPSHLLAFEEDAQEVEEVAQTTQPQEEAGEHQVLYQDGKIYLYHVQQLQAIGTNEAVTDQDDDPDSFGVGSPILDGEEIVCYSLDADYILANDISLDVDWHVPEQFTGSFTALTQEDKTTLYDETQDAIYIYNTYQLDLLHSPTAASEPVLSHDNQCDQVGMGTFLYPSNSENYITYSKSHHYILSQHFTLERPELIVNQIKEERSQPKAMSDWSNATLDGRDYIGQVYKEIAGEKYILIGNSYQLSAIGSNKQVAPALFKKEGLISSNITLYYPGDADFDPVNQPVYQGNMASYNKDVLLDPNFTALDPVTKYYVYDTNTKEYKKEVTNNALHDEYNDIKYSKSANYIIFRDIDLNGVAWTPLMFSGTMIGAKNETASLWDDAGAWTSSNQAVTISNVHVEQSGDLDIGTTSGIGFFGSITSELDQTSIGVSKGLVTVKNIYLKNVSVDNQSVKIQDKKGLISGILTILTAILGPLLPNNLEEVLNNLLDPSQNKDPTVFATGGFAGRISGQVLVENCRVDELQHIDNAMNMSGGFVGNSEGVTEYGTLQTRLGQLVSILTKVLDIIPFLDLGTLLDVLLDGNIIDIDQLIPTGYYSPQIIDCHVSGSTLTIGDPALNFAGGFAGRQVGTLIQNSSVDVNDLTIQAKNLAGGFSGLSANADLQGLLKNLGVDLVKSLRLNSFVLNSSVNASTLSITSAEQYAGGIAGSLNNSFVLDSGVTGNVYVAGKQYVGGISGRATLAQSISLGDELNPKGKNLISFVDGLISGITTGEQQHTLLALTGVNSSVLAGVFLNGTVNINAKESYAGGLVGQGDGTTILASDSAALKQHSFIWNQTGETLGYTPKNQENTITDLTQVSATSYSGGIAGEVVMASAAGLLNQTLGFGNYLSFTIEQTNINGATSATVSSSSSYAGGAFGQLIGGSVQAISIQGIAQISADNYVGGFVGSAGTGSLAEAGGLNILGLVSISNLLSIADGIQTTIRDCSVIGDPSFQVFANGGTGSDQVSEYFAGGFIGESKSAQIARSHVENLKFVSANAAQGFAGGFCGSARTGGLSEAVGNDTSALGNLVSISNVLTAIPYLIPKFEDTTVTFTSNGEQPQVEGAYAGGFVGELQSGNVDNSSHLQNGGTDPYAVYGIEVIHGSYDAGGFAGKAYAGGLASSNGLQLLGGVLNINLQDIASLLSAYIPHINSAGVSSRGLMVQANTYDALDSTTGAAGGYIGYGSGIQIKDSSVQKLATTHITPPDHLNQVEASSYFDPAQSSYAIQAQRYAGGYIGFMDIGSTAEVGGGLDLLGSSLSLNDVTSVLDVAASKIEGSDVVGTVGGFSVLANGTENDKDDVIGHAGGFAGLIHGSIIQACNVDNFAYIIAQESAGGYVGSMQPGDVASAIGDTSILGGLLQTEGNLASILQSFIPIIENSQATCIPCGGAIRAQGTSDATRARGIAGGYVGENLGGRIAGNVAEKGTLREAAIIRLRSVYGTEFAGGFSGRMECANVADTGSIHILYGLVQATNPIQALSAVYPIQRATGIYGPLRQLNVEEWNDWVDAVGVNGAYGNQIHQVTSLEELETLLPEYAYGFEISAGRDIDGPLPTQAGVAGGYVGRMDGGIISDANANDLKSVNALRSSGGFVAEMVAAGVANVNGLNIAGINVLGNLPVLQSFVPVIKDASIHGYASGATIETLGHELANGEGYAGGYVGLMVGGQIGSEHQTFNEATNLRKVSGASSVGGFAGAVLPGSAVDVNVDSSDGLLSKLLGGLLTAPQDLAQVLNATISTIQYAKVDAWNDWGIQIIGASEALGEYPTTAGGFVGYASGAVLGIRDANSANMIANGIRSVQGGEHTGGFFGLGDVSALAQVGQGQGASILNLIKLGESDVLDAFRTYIYHGEVHGSGDQGLSVISGYENVYGTGKSTVYSGNAGGFGGSLLNGSVKDSQVTQLNTVKGLNGTGGFIGHAGKSGTVDIDEIGTDSALAGLLNGTLGVLDVFGSNVERSTVTGIKDGYLVKSVAGQQPIAGGFIGYGDLARVEDSKAIQVKQVSSDEIAGGFMGETSFAYLTELNVDSQILLDPILSVVTALLEHLYVGDLEQLNLINITLPGPLHQVLSLHVLKDGDVLSLTLLGLPISVSLVQSSEGGTDLAKVQIGDSFISLPCSYQDGKVQIDQNEAKENIKIGLIKANRTKIARSSVQGIPQGYDVFGGTADNEHDGTSTNGYSGGFIGLNHEGLLEENMMEYADTIRGTKELIGPFTGKTTLDSVYEENTVKGIEGSKNEYFIYRVADAALTQLKKNEILNVDFQIITNENQTWNCYKIQHFDKVQSLKDLDGVEMSDDTGGQKQELLAYVSSAKAVLMADTPTTENDMSITPPPSDMQDPCDELVHITIDKIWKDFHDFDQIRPNHITISLTRTYTMADGTEKSEPVEGYQLLEFSQNGDNNTWQMILSDLPAYGVDGDGKKYYYRYSVKEFHVEGYDSSIENPDYMIKITNTHTPVLPVVGGIGVGIFTLIGVTGLIATLKKRGKKDERI